jgi:uncharacterized protein YggT (Ycf19 family)
MHFEFDNPELANAFDDVFAGFYKAIWFWWRVWILAAELRIMIQMFLNINPYFFPVYYLWLATDPMFNFGRKFYPKLMGFDLCPFINFTIAQKIESQLDLLAHGVDKFNRYKFDKNTTEDKYPNMMPGSDFWKAEESTLNSTGLLASSHHPNLTNITNLDLAFDSQSYFVFPGTFSHFHIF